MPIADPHTFLRSLLDAAIASAQPALCVPPYLPAPETVNGRLVVLGAGKASAAMAQSVEAHWAGEISGLVVTRYGYAVPCTQIEIVEAAHPVPDEAGEIAAKRMIQLAESLTSDDFVLCLISGGGSSLLPLALDGISLADKQAVNKALLASGATINEMNCVRRHLSAIKGGRLAQAIAPARSLTLLISDVPGDDPINIASGPTVGDPTSCSDALDLVERYAIDLPAAVLKTLKTGSGESIKPDDACLTEATTKIIAAPQLALEAAAQKAREAGITPFILGDALEGEARDVGKTLAAIAQQVAKRNQPVAAPCVLLSGGETTVTMRGNGRGGRNVELLLSMALTLDSTKGIYALAGDTDGVDGVEEIAGALIGPDTLDRARAAGLHPPAVLANNDAHTFFEKIGDSVVTGPTLTNVNDFRAILINPA
jgi:hydroxypyruvate reductase